MPEQDQHCSINSGTILRASIVRRLPRSKSGMKRDDMEAAAVSRGDNTDGKDAAETQQRSQVKIVKMK